MLGPCSFSFAGAMDGVELARTIVSASAWSRVMSLVIEHGGIRAPMEWLKVFVPVRLPTPSGPATVTDVGHLHPVPQYSRRRDSARCRTDLVAAVAHDNVVFAHYTSVRLAVAPISRSPAASAKVSLVLEVVHVGRRPVKAPPVRHDIGTLAPVPRPPFVDTSPSVGSPGGTSISDDAALRSRSAASSP